MSEISHAIAIRYLGPVTFGSEASFNNTKILSLANDIDAAIAAEREACAVALEGLKPRIRPFLAFGEGYDAACDDGIRAIRARGEGK